MKGPVDAVVFDVGGVLVDWHPNYLYRSLISDEAQRHQFLTSICDDRWNLRQDAGQSLPQTVIELAARHPQQAELIASWWTRWPEMLSDCDRDVLRLARRLQTNGVALYAITNWSAETWPLAIQRFGFLDDLFIDAVISGREHVAKPDPEIFCILSRHNQLDVTTALFVDDSPVNTAAAEALGYLPHTFTTADALEVELTAYRLL